jgi:hypothetical protein
MNKSSLSLFTLLLLACQTGLNQSPIPNVPVDIEINLNDLDNAPLQLIGGYIYLDGGVRGIILRRETQTIYRAFDRNCTFQPSDACAIVEVHSSGFYIEDTCCQSVFDLSGFPTGGPATFPLKEYQISIADDRLFITN